jgi:hypothetical protein
MTAETAPEFGVEIIPADLHRAWRMPEKPVEVWEEAAPDGWSFYHLPDGKAACIMETVRADWPAVFVHMVLCRVVANLTCVCPACGAGARLGSAVYQGRPVDGFMTHENACPLSDPALSSIFAAGGDAHAEMPPPPRYWIVWVPRLRPGYRPRRRFVP